MRKESPRRAVNEENTRIINNFLDKYIYTEDNGFYDFERINDRDRQVAGIDIEFSFRDNIYHADEKAASDYINRENPLATFSMELAFVNRRNEVVDGWFIRNDLSTDSYVFVWVDKADMYPYNGDERLMALYDEQSIKVADIALVRKNDLKDYLKSLGWTEERLREKCQRIIEKNGVGENMGNVWRNGCKFSYSKHLVEKPVNILLPREKLIEMSVFSKHVG